MQIGLGVGVPFRRNLIYESIFSPLSLFASGEQGTWYDPSDFSTMFQDKAGTAPVTSVGQPVGLILDKSKGLALGANLISNSEQFTTAAGWSTENGMRLSASGGLLVALPNEGTAYPTASGCSVVPGKTYRVRVRAWKSQSNPHTVWFGWISGAPNINLSTTPKTYEFTYTPNSFTGPTLIYAATSIVADAETYIESVSVQELPGNHASQPTATSRPLLQQDATGKYYLSFDGVDDFLATQSVDFTSTDKVTVFAGLRKLSDITTGGFIELGTDIASYSGAFALFAPSTSGSYRFISRGTSVVRLAGTGTYAPSPDTSVITGIGDISGDITSIRRNGSIVEVSTLDQGTGNYGNYPLFIGRRAGTSSPFNGNLYSLIIRGAQSTDAQITQTETWVNSKTGAY